MNETKLDRIYRGVKETVAALRASNERHQAETGIVSTVSEADYETLELREVAILVGEATEATHS